MTAASPILHNGYILCPTGHESSQASFLQVISSQKIQPSDLAQGQTLWALGKSDTHYMRLDDLLFFGLSTREAQKQQYRPLFKRADRIYCDRYFSTPNNTIRSYTPFEIKPIQQYLCNLPEKNTDIVYVSKAFVDQYFAPVSFASTPLMPLILALSRSHSLIAKITALFLRIPEILYQTIFFLTILKVVKVFTRIFGGIGAARTLDVRIANTPLAINL